MLTEKYVYKAVLGRDTKLFTSYGVEGAASLTYALGQATTPPAWLLDVNQGLFVFSTFAEARTYINNWGTIHNSTILECEWKDEMPPAKEAWLALLFIGKFEPYDNSIGIWPKGTHFVREVVPIREVDPN